MENKETAGLMQGLLMMVFSTALVEKSVFIELINEISELKAIISCRCVLT